MEGLAALSLIANTFQVVDFSYQILKAAWEAYKTGALSSNASQEQIALDLRTANDSLQAKLKTNARQNVSKDDQATLDLASKATAIADELLQHLKKFNSSTKSRPFRSICNAVKASWTREKISGMVQDLESLRDEVEYRIVISLRAAADDHGSQLAGLDMKTSAVLNAVIDSKSIYRDELQRQAQALTQCLTVSEHAADKRHAEVLTAVQSLSVTLSPAKIATTTTVAPTGYRHDRALTATAILEWLCFARMEARRDAIKERHRKTFEWVFDSTRTVRGSPLGFVQWAVEGSGIYWIKGKAGSGKSTLMKMISEEQRTYQMLCEWAGDDELLFSSFYFWNQGSEMQRSTVGLLRSLLYDILKDRTEMTAIALPNWLPKFMSLDPTLDQMISAILRVINSCDARRKVAFMIDGLDEFEGDSSDMTAMAKFLSEMAHAPHVKILVFSRPLQPFEVVFQGCLKLVVQDLTADDIRLVARETIGSHSRMADLLEEYPQRAASLMDDIVEKSSGVFLWVRFAISAVLDGLQSYDGIDELEARLNELPPDLNELFDLVIRRIPPRYREDAYRLLQISHRWQKIGHSSLEAITCLFSLKAGQLVLWEMPIAPLEAQQFREYLDQLAVLLRTRCLGLLEVEETFERPSHQGLSRDDYSSQDDWCRYECCLESSYSVRFLHRSVLEFLETSESLRMILEERYASFDVHVAIMEGMVIRLKTSHWEWIDDSTVLQDVMAFNRLAEASTGRPQTRMLNTLDATLSTLHMTRNGDRKSDPHNHHGDCLQLTDHWSNDIYGACAAPTTDKSTFLSYTIGCGAALYVKDQLDMSTITVSRCVFQIIMESVFGWHVSQNRENAA
ncbi:hypothetical protein LTR37_018266 [Vermiconidia calcicola]|uniref:Uncharacterized protein n=1 Tax=Vermiconidia calcicola TaxID=1690605 RepID=A0ACC3MHD1_9PEZI|nr:hypothetical protein LTR37_018266 [Vermiconidia calcicola]